MEQFEKDPFPGRPKILFIGLSHSSHSHSWINLLQDSEFNVRFFSTPESELPPSNWEIRTYVIRRMHYAIKDSLFRKYFYPPYNLVYKRLYNNGFFILPQTSGVLKILLAGLALLFYVPIRFIEKVYELISFTKNPNFNRNLFGNKLRFIRLFGPKAPTIEDWLVQIIREWQPDIIHTLGVFDGQGGEFYYSIRKKYHLENYGLWVLQLRGGSDLTLRMHDPDKILNIRNILSDCDQILSDNLINLEFVKQLKIPVQKFAAINPVPGTGGIDIRKLNSNSNLKPSARRLILVPKAYECIWSKAIPILESIQLAWDEIQPCEVVFLAVNSEVQTYFYAFPSRIRQYCRIEDRLPHKELLNLMLKARIVLAPSLIDGVPNVLYEAMACGAFPIVSPLKTIMPIVKNEENVLFARNLNVQEIAMSLVRAMNDDVLIDQAAKNNLNLVSKIADRKKIQKQVVDFYDSIYKAMGASNE